MFRLYHFILFSIIHSYNSIAPFDYYLHVAYCYYFSHIFIKYSHIFELLDYHLN